MLFHYRLFRKLFFILFILPTLLFLLTNAVIFAYIYWPASYKDIKLEAKADTYHLTLISHGLKDKPDSWANPLKMQLAQPRKNKKSKHIQSLDWQTHSTNAFKCSVNGLRIGKQLAQQASSLKELKSVHLIAHSCGSFINYGFCQEIKKLRPSTIVHTTYLDPASIYGGLFWQFGINNFGSCADFSDHYFDSSDGVPGSNVALKNTYSIDVTKARKQQDIHPHLWPTIYYLQLAKKKQILLYKSDVNKNYPRGQLKIINNITIKADTLIDKKTK